MDTIWIEATLILLAILANGLFSGSEFALVSARLSRLNHLREEGVRGAATALALKRDPETFLATVQIAITLVGTLASAVGGAAAIEALTPWLQGLPLPGASRWAEPVALGVVILALTYVSLVVGELVPKALALRNPERAACLVAPMLRASVRAAAWPSRFLTRSTRAVLAVLGQRGAPMPSLVSEEEIRYLVREGAAQGVLERHESDLVDRVFRSTDTPVRAVMVPRNRILALDLDTPSEAVLSRAATLNRTADSSDPGLAGRRSRRRRAQGSAPGRRLGQAAGAGRAPAPPAHRAADGADQRGAPDLAAAAPEHGAHRRRVRPHRGTRDRGGS